MKNLSFKAIIVAFLADFGVTQILVSIFSAVLLVASPQARALMVSGNVTALTLFLANWAAFLALGLFCACLGQILGGFVAALLAPIYPKLNAMAAAAVALLISVFLITSYPLWYQIVTLALIIPCYWLGALIAIRRNAAKSANSFSVPETAPISPPH